MFRGRSKAWLGIICLSIPLSGCRLGYEIWENGTPIDRSPSSPGDGGSDGSGNTTGAGGDETSGGGAGSGGVASSGGDTGSGGVASSGGDTGSGGVASSGGDTGSGGAAGTGGAAGGTTAPFASFTVSAYVGTTSTSFSFDASASSDVEDPDGSLTFEWDFEGTSSLVSSGLTPSHSYGATGDYTVTLRVTDTDGQQGWYSQIVHVVSGGDILRVTTAADEDDSGATATVPLGAGLSLREAITLSESTAGRQVIQLGDGLITSPGSNLPQVHAPVDIIGDGTGGINGTSLGASSNCLQIFAGDTRVIGLEIYNCPRNGFQITTGNGVEVSRCHVYDIGQYGVFVGTSSNHTITNNLIERTDYGIDVASDNTLVQDNDVYDSAGFGIFLANPSTGSVVVGNRVVGSNIGIQIGGPNITFVHNTLVNSSSFGTEVIDPGTIYRFNIIAYSGNMGINGTSGMFADLSNNIFFNTSGGICSSCAPNGTNTTVDPLFVNYGAEDFRLQPESPAVDAATSLGYDRNGSAPGLFWGDSPDYGYHEQ